MSIAVNESIATPFEDALDKVEMILDAVQDDVEHIIEDLDAEVDGDTIVVTGLVGNVEIEVALLAITVSKSGLGRVRTTLTQALRDEVAKNTVRHLIAA